MILQKGVLHGALGPLRQLADRQAAHDRPGHVLFVARGGKLELSASDSVSWLRTSVSCKKAFSVVLPVKPLLELLRPADHADRDGAVEFHAVEEGQVVAAVEGAMATMSALPLEQHPRPPVTSRATPVMSWCVSELRDALKWVLAAASLDASSPGLAGVLFDGEHAVATDGHRLHRARLPRLRSPMLVASSAVVSLLRVMPARGQVELLRSGDVLVFRAGGWELVTRPMNATDYPSYTHVIPSEQLEELRATVDGGQLHAVIRRLTRTSGRASAIQMHINGALELVAFSKVGRSSAKVPVLKNTHSGPDFVIGVNPGYLRDAISDNGEVTLRFNGDGGPIVVERASDRLAVVMPVKL